MGHARVPYFRIDNSRSLVIYHCSRGRQARSSSSLSQHEATTAIFTSDMPTIFQIGHP